MRAQLSRILSSVPTRLKVSVSYLRVVSLLLSNTAPKTDCTGCTFSYFLELCSIYYWDQTVPWTSSGSVLRDFTSTPIFWFGDIVRGCVWYETIFLRGSKLGTDFYYANKGCHYHCMFASLHTTASRSICLTTEKWRVWRLHRYHRRWRLSCWG